VRTLAPCEVSLATPRTGVDGQGGQARASPRALCRRVVPPGPCPDLDGHLAEILEPLIFTRDVATEALERCNQTRLQSELVALIASMFPCRMLRFINLVVEGTGFSEKRWKMPSIAFTAGSLQTTEY